MCYYVDEASNYQNPEQWNEAIVKRFRGYQRDHLIPDGNRIRRFGKYHA